MRIELKQFGQHAALAIEASTPVVMAVGKNRCGKTTLRDAIEFALLGTCALRGFTLKKDVARYMIRDAADHAGVELSFGDWAVRRSVRSNGTQKITVDASGNGGWVEYTAGDWEDAFPFAANPLAVRCALESDALWHATPAERSAMLVALADGGPLTAERIVAEIPASLAGDGNVVDRDVLWRLARTAASKGFAAADAEAVEVRRAAKRQREALSSFTDPQALLVDGVDPRDFHADDWRSTLARARAALAAAQAQSAHRAGRHEGVRDACRERLDAALQQEERAELRRSEAFPNSWPGVEELREEYASRRERAVAIIDRQGAIRERVEALRAKLVEPGDVPAAPAPPSACPASMFPMACPAKPAAFEKARAAVVSEMTKRWALRQQERDDAGLELDVLGNEAKALDEEHASVDAWCRETSATIETLVKLNRAIDEARAARGRAEVELNCAEKALADYVPPPEVDIPALAAAVSRGERLLQERERFDRDVAARQRALAEEKQLGVLVEWLDALEHEFRPDGVERRLAADGAGGLRSDIAAGSEVFGPIELTADFDVTISGRHIAAASKSEQRCAGLVLQVAIARAMQIPVVVVDELDCLDAEWRGRFGEYVAAEGALDGVQLLGLATTDAEPPGSPPEGYTTAWLRPNRVEILRAEEGAS